MKRVITIPATGMTVTLGTYVRGVKFAIASPEAEFKHGLTCWWPCKGKDIRRQFREGMHERINAGIPAMQRGM